MNQCVRKSFLILFLVVCGHVRAQVHPGMKADAFRKALPGVMPERVYYNEDLSFGEKLGSFNGRWHLDFNHDSLRSVEYSARLHTGHGYMAAFDTVVKQYTETMGTPAWAKTGHDTGIYQGRVRKAQTDTLRAVCWKTRYAEVVAGLYYTGDDRVKKRSQEDATENLANADKISDHYRFGIRVNKADHAGEAFTWELYPGLHIYKVIELRPAWLPNGKSIYGEWGRKETLYGLEGNWNYVFRNSRLDTMSWYHCAGKQDKATFEQCLKATQKIIADYTTQYGIPVIETGDTKYRDPYRKQHPGYDVLKAYWDMKTYTIEIKYVFAEANGRYDLVVKIGEGIRH